MKRILFLFVAIMVSTVSVSAQKQYAEMKFDSTEYDFGTFYKDVNKLSHTFTFTNTGTMPAIINKAVTTCGCTVATYTKEPVAPGKKGTVVVEYNPIGRFPGEFKRTITLMTNAKKQMCKLYIKGNMIERP